MSIRLRTVGGLVTKELRALGVTSGVGSMLIGARAAGFKVIGNLEWRRYYHLQDSEGRNTFRENFPGAFLKWKYDDLTPEEKEQIHGVDLIVGHPECGNFSSLQVCNKAEKCKDPSDIPLFIDLMKTIRPRFFVMDNLPKALMAVPLSSYAETLSDYDLFPEWISNFHYGNTQINRRRLFIIGALKEERFAFRPGEFMHNRMLRDIIGDLPVYGDIRELNHLHVPDNQRYYGWSPYWFGFPEKEFFTMAEFKEVIRDYPVKKNIAYTNRKGEQKFRIGRSKIILDHFSPVMSGGGAAIDNHFRADTLNPLTSRERARIQGCPDDFIFYPLDYLVNHKTNLAVYKQIGKFMPVEFCTFIGQEILAHITGEPFKVTGERLIKPNPLIDENKIWYCQNIGYSNQDAACLSCWLANDSGCPGGVIRSGGTINLNPVDGPETTDLSVIRGASTHAKDAVRFLYPFPGEDGAIPGFDMPRETVPGDKYGKIIEVNEDELVPPELDYDPRLQFHPPFSTPFLDGFEPEKKLKSKGVAKMVDLPVGEDPTIYRLIEAVGYSFPGEIGPVGLEPVNLSLNTIPENYHWFTGYMNRYLGELIRPDGSYYSRLDRRAYYSPSEKGHIDKTPLHAARWAIQTLTKPGDWVLDPTMGAGTTAVEALRHGRSVAGVELEPDYYQIIMENIRINNPLKMGYMIRNGDAREIQDFLKDWKLGHPDDEISLIVNNPPYSGDIRQSGLGVKNQDTGKWDQKVAFYSKKYPNLAFLKESRVYWETLAEIYGACIEYLKPGGYFTIGVKDMMRNKRPYPLHQYLADLLVQLGLKYVGVVILKHYPGTLHLHTYEKRTGGIKPPFYQTITIFQKEL